MMANDTSPLTVSQIYSTLAPVTFAIGNVCFTAADSPEHGFNDRVASLLNYQASRTVWKYCPPVILVFGTFGSVMTLWILNQPHMGSSALLVYFKALAVSDLCLLYTGLLRNWIKFSFGFEIRDVHTAVCKIHIFLVYLSGMTSSWFLVAMTSQRAMSVVKPHRIHALCSRRSSKLMVVFIVVFCSVLNAHNLYGYSLRYYEGDGEYYCDYLDSVYEDFARGPWPWIDLIFSSLLPFVLVIISNTLMMWKVAASVRRIKRMTSFTNLEAVTQRKKESTSLTLTLVCLCALFLLLTSPLAAYLVADVFFRSDLDPDPKLRGAAELAWAVTNILWYTNSAVNFYLYCLSGSRFRSQVLKLVACGRRELGERAPQGEEGVQLRAISALVGPARPNVRVRVPRNECVSEF